VNPFPADAQAEERFVAYLRDRTGAVSPWRAHAPRVAGLERGGHARGVEPGFRHGAEAERRPRLREANLPAKQCEAHAW